MAPDRGSALWPRTFRSRRPALQWWSKNPTALDSTSTRRSPQRSLQRLACTSAWASSRGRVADFSPYTPDPSVTNYLQGVIAPQQIATDPSGAPTSDTQLSLGSNAPPTPPPQSFGFAPGVSGVPDAGETTDYGIPSTIASAVQSGFAPTAGASQLPSVTGGVLPTQSPPPPAPVVQTSPDVSLGTAN